MTPFVLLTVLSTAALLAAEWRGLRPGVWIAKPLASSGFVAAAWAAGASDSVYGRAVLAALALSWLGDVLLIARRSPGLFRAGLASFLVAHLAYAGAFLARGLHPGATGLGVLAVVAPGLWALRWLRPHLPPGMAGPVHAYVAVISTMLACAAGTLPGSGGPAIALGAGLFYASDLAVARQRFVAPSFWNRAWGLPAYYAGQLVLASTVA